MKILILTLLLTLVLMAVLNRAVFGPRAKSRVLSDERNSK